MSFQKAESKKKISTAAAKFAGLKSGLSQGLKREKSVKSTTGSNSSSTSQQQQQGVQGQQTARCANSLQTSAPLSKGKSDHVTKWNTRDNTIYLAEFVIL